MIEPEHAYSAERPAGERRFAVISGWVASVRTYRCPTAGSSIPMSGAVFRVWPLLRKVRIGLRAERPSESPRALTVASQSDVGPHSAWPPLQNGPRLADSPSSCSAILRSCESPPLFLWCRTTSSGTSKSHAILAPTLPRTRIRLLT